MFFFSSLNQRYDIIICVYWFELFSQVSDVAHGPLVLMFWDYGVDFCFIQKAIIKKKYKTPKSCIISPRNTTNDCFTSSQTMAKMYDMLSHFIGGSYVCRLWTVAWDDASFIESKEYSAV